MRRTPAVVLAASLAFALPANADEHRGVTYVPPAGWQGRVDPATGAMVLVPGDLAAGERLVVLLEPATPVGKGTLASQFAASVEAAHARAEVHARGKVEQKSEKGATTHVQMVHLTDRELGEHRRLYAQVAIGTRKTFVTVVLPTTDPVFARYGGDVMKMIATIDFAGPAATATPGTPPASRPAGHGDGRAGIPTGNTPDLFPGMPGWRPSGRGIAIPDPSLAGGAPRGLWWKVEATGAGLKPVVHFYLDGVRASNPRLGGGRLFDREGQAGGRGSTGVGTFVLADGKITETYDGFVRTERFTAGKDASGTFFQVGAATFRPLVPLSAQTLAAEWKSSSVVYRFNPDGSYASTLGPGTWILDGYLLLISPGQGAPFIAIAGMAGEMLAFGSGLYYRGR